MPRSPDVNEGGLYDPEDRAPMIFRLGLYDTSGGIAAHTRGHVASSNTEGQIAKYNQDGVLPEETAGESVSYEDMLDNGVFPLPYLGGSRPTFPPKNLDPRTS